MNKVLIVAEHAGGKLNPAIAKCVTCARGIPDAEVTVAVLELSAPSFATYVKLSVVPASGLGCNGIARKPFAPGFNHWGMGLVMIWPSSPTRP